MCLGIVSACPKIQIWKNIGHPKIQMFGTHSYQLGWAIYIYIKSEPYMLEVYSGKFLWACQAAIHALDRMALRAVHSPVCIQ